MALKHYFYDVYENYTKLFSESEEWIGTAYQHGGWKKKCSVDCIHLIGLIYKECGVITEVQAPAYYPINWYLSGENKIINTINEHLENFLGEGVVYEFHEDVEESELIEGDLICLRLGQSSVANHVAIKLDKNRIVHANSKAKKVVCESIETYQASIVGAYVFFKNEEKVEE